MTATAPTKAAPKWKLFLRRLFRRTPFWGKRLEDQEEGPDIGFGAVADSIAAVIQIFVFGAIFVLPLVVLVSGWIFFSPGFFEHGLADPIGRGLAQVCLVTGNCDLRYLIAGAALAVPIVVLMAFTIQTGLWYANDDEAEVSETELLDAVSLLDERIVHLRADLVLAGVLRLSPEELEEDGD